MKFVCFLVFNKRHNNAVTSQSSYVLNVLTINQNNENNQVCDVTSLYGIILETNISISIDLGAAYGKWG